jgi:hypothetical protein
MKNQFFLLLAIVALIVSCNKENEPVKPDYFQLKAGNYWIYQTYELAGDSVEDVIPFTDSTYIEKDTVINGNVYYKFMSQSFTGGMHTPSFARDSAGCLINESGKISFSYTNFTDTLSTYTEGNIFRATYMMEKHDSLVNVPAGSFNALFCHVRIVMYNPSYPYGTRHQGTFFADGVGCVKSTSASLGSSDRYLDTRLIRYHVR